MVHKIDHAGVKWGGGGKTQFVPPQLRHCCLHVVYNIKTKSKQNHKLEYVNIPKIILSIKFIFNELSRYSSRIFLWNLVQTYLILKILIGFKGMLQMLTCYKLLLIFHFIYFELSSQTLHLWNSFRLKTISP